MTGYGWDCTIGALLSKGGVIAVHANGNEYDILNARGSRVGVILAEPRDWVGEQRIKLIGETLVDAEEHYKKLGYNVITEENDNA